MRTRLCTTLLLGFLALHCDLGQTPPPLPPEDITQVPWVAGKITSASDYPIRPISMAEVTISWGSGHLSTFTDTSGSFRLQQLPRAIVTFRATATYRDTVTLTLDLISSDTANVEVALKMQKGFVPGQICVGFRDTTSLRTFVRFADSRGLPIKSAVEFEFLTDSISADSVQSIKSLLLTKPYLTAASIATNNTRVSVWHFKDLTPELLQDWESTCNQLGFREVQPRAKFAVLLVSSGTEHAWIRELSGESILKYICLNLLAEVFGRAAT